MENYEILFMRSDTKTWVLENDLSNVINHLNHKKKYINDTS